MNLRLNPDLRFGRWWCGIALIAASVLFPSAQTAVAAKPYRPPLGKPHPDFVLPSIEDGAPIRLSQFRGKKVLLIHFASW